MEKGVKWFAGLVAGGMLLVSAVSVSAVVRSGPPATTIEPVLTSSVDGSICLTPRAPKALAASSCEACWQCINRDGPSEQCLALCERLECDPGAPNPRCDVVVLCTIGYRWDATACQCLPDRSGN